MIGILGGQVLTLLSASSGAIDRKGIPATVYTPTVVSGCSIQPLDVKEDVTNIDYYLGKFNVFLPASPVTLACKTTDYILAFPAASTTADLPLNSYVAGATSGVYRVMGAKVWFDFMGSPDHVTAVAEIPSGLNG